MNVHLTHRYDTERCCPNQLIIQTKHNRLSHPEIILSINSIGPAMHVDALLPPFLKFANQNIHGITTSFYGGRSTASPAFSEYSTHRTGPPRINTLPIFFFVRNLSLFGSNQWTLSNHASQFIYLNITQLTCKPQRSWFWMWYDSSNLANQNWPHQFKMKQVNRGSARFYIDQTQTDCTPLIR